MSKAMKIIYDTTRSKLKPLFCSWCKRDTPHHESQVRGVVYYVCAECGEVTEVQR